MTNPKKKVENAATNKNNAAIKKNKINAAAIKKSNDEKMSRNDEKIRMGKINIMNMSDIFELNKSKRKWDEEKTSKREEDRKKYSIPSCNTFLIDDLKNNVLKNTSLNIKDVLSGLISEDDMSKLLETITEVQKIELEEELKKENKENKETENKNSKSFAESEYSSQFNSNFFNSGAWGLGGSVAESKSKNIVLNISSSINLNVSSQETINLTINIS